MANSDASISACRHPCPRSTAGTCAWPLAWLVARLASRRQWRATAARQPIQIGILPVRIAAARNSMMSRTDQVIHFDVPTVVCLWHRAFPNLRRYMVADKDLVDNSMGTVFHGQSDLQPTCPSIGYHQTHGMGVLGGETTGDCAGGISPDSAMDRMRLRTSGWISRRSLSPSETEVNETPASRAIPFDGNLPGLPACQAFMVPLSDGRNDSGNASGSASGNATGSIP